MPELHPHWQSTSTNPKEEEKVVQPSAPAQGKRIARYPAAIVGIALVCTLSFGFFHGIKNITAQLVNEVTVRITENGFEPADITVEPGATIAWINETSRPAILSSDTLCNSDYEMCLYSAVFLEGDTWRFDVPTDVPVKAGNIYMLVTGSATGSITVGGATPAPDTPPAAPVQPVPDTPTPTPAIAPTDTVQPDLEPTVPTAPPTPSVVPQTEPETQTNTDAPATAPTFGNPFAAQEMEGAAPTVPSQSTGGAAEIPRNPYTVGSSYVPTTPLLPPGTNTDNALHSGAPPPVTVHTPFSQPETGAGIWMIALSVLCALGYLYWKKPSKAVVRF